MNRYKNNLIILNILREYLENNPDIRFIQALWNLKIIDRDPVWNIREVNNPIDRFYEEPDETLKRISRTKG